MLQKSKNSVDAITFNVNITKLNNGFLPRDYSINVHLPKFFWISFMLFNSFD